LEDLDANAPSPTVLDKAHMEYSYKHPTLLTLTVDAAGASSDHEWRLPTFDPRNEKKYLYKLHTIDIYFWEKEDAELFLNAARRMVPEKQMAILDEPAAPAAHHEEMSPVVQQLENVAISDPSYQKGQTRDSRPSASFAGPPLSAVPQPEKVPEKAFSPMAYNPAAPAAPEAIRHREKTPPPEDGAANPLAAAAASDQGQAQGYNQFVPPPVSAFGPPSQPLYFAGPPQAGHAGSPYAAPPPSALSRAQSYPQTLVQQAGYNGQHAAYLGQQALMQSPGFSPPPQYSQAPPPPAASPPQGGYSNYQYSPAQAAPLSNEYSIHQQIYRPTEGEHAIKHKPAKAPRGQLEDSAQKLEKGITSFLKKVEKKYG
jgi:hypothetical protein